MSCPAGRPSMRALAVKSVSGSASTKTARWMVLKLSVVATSASMRAGRSARAQITAESSETSPDWMPWVMTGRSAARLRYGLRTTADIVVDAAAVARNRRRDRGMRTVMETLQLPERGEDGGEISQNADGYRTTS